MSRPKPVALKFLPMPGAVKSRLLDMLAEIRLRRGEAGLREAYMLAQEHFAEYIEPPTPPTAIAGALFDEAWGHFLT